MSLRPGEIEIKDWKRFQHYKRRSPPWIRLYRDLVDNTEWRGLSDSAARLLVELWVLASELQPGGRVPHDLTLIAWKTGRRGDDPALAPALDELAAAGFVRLPAGRASANASKATRQSQSQNNPTESETPSGASPPVSVVTKPDPADWMHALWQETLGSTRPLDLTTARRQKYRAMYAEQLADSPDPVTAWRAVLHTLAASDFHMGKREYQLPESFLRSAERRSQWVEKALDLAKTGGVVSKQRQDVIRIHEHFRRNQA